MTRRAAFLDRRGWTRPITGRTPTSSSPRNRLPVQVTLTDGKVELEHSPAVWRRRCGVCAASHVWVGWPGTVVPPEYEIRVGKRLAADDLYPVFLSREEEEGFYGRICNDSIWPLFHYLPGRFSFAQDAWDRYVDVNERFADAIARALHARASRLGARLPADARARGAARGGAPTCRSASSCTSRSRRPRSTACCRRASRSCAGCSAPTTSASTPATTRGTSARRCLRVLGIDSEPDVVEHEGRARRHRRRPDRHRRRELPRDARGSGDRSRPGRDRGALRGPAADPRRRAARLHERDPAEAAGVRAVPRAGSGARADDDDAPDPRPLPAREPRVPRSSATRSSSRSPTSTAASASPAGRPSSTCTGASRRRSSSRSTGAPT